MASTFVEGGNVHANGIRQHYLRYGGKGQPLILVPGITSPAITWGFVGDRLGQRFDTYVLDVRGRGLSQAGDLDYGIDACADDIAAFTSALGLEQPVVMGHSMGARFAIRAARRHPGAFAKLVLVDPPVSGPGRRAYPAKLDWYVDSIRLAMRGCDAEDMRPFLPKWTKEELQLRAEWLHTCDETAVVTAFEGFQTDDIHVDLPHLAMPVLLVIAGGATVILPEDAAEIKNLLPDVRIATVEGAGHMIPWDSFDGFFAAIDPFLT
ncbi:N-formylmaleamate deformylase [Arboricoccus pini]|uniref:N-formylmaleamate deformylase n=1 Tax=Arboricoccus pini TaxID=1963835 RepID=A0A212RJ31_9PROT|nr:alpha/beta hydrolase [Arboricoccus pini]SNB72365.1 N-formylmaleamate deformylase [Arboricoccus pini]